MSGVTFGRSGKRGSALLLVAVLLVIQLATWRGRSRLHAVSYGVQRGSHVLQKRATYAFAPQEGDDEELGGLKKKKKDKHKDKKKEKHDKHKKQKKDSRHKTHSTSSSHTRTHTSTSSITATTSTSTKHHSPSSTAIPECRPLPISASPDAVCQHVRAYCPPTGHLDYLQFFYCIGLNVTSTGAAEAIPTKAPVFHTNLTATTLAAEHDAGLTTRVKALRVMALSSIIAWMLFLFSWVGIVASDFFCPNLGTLSARLGLSESTAGVTFLAFGNGSPDVFSTFGAMRTGSGSLAIGELLGAASFIVSVISGSMMLIAPFRVKKYPFLRDVGFFTVAVSMTMTFLLDGKLLLGECLSMIALYLLYATTIIIGSWWQERRRLQKLRIANIRSEHSVSSAANYEDLSETGGAPTHSAHGGRQSPLLPQLSAIEYEPDVDPFVTWAEQQDAMSHQPPAWANSPVVTPTDLSTASPGNTARLQRFRNGIMARHSLLGAVEFRDVVQSLRKEASMSDRSMEIYQSRDPERFLPHPHSGHHHLHPDHASSGGRGHSRTKSLVARPHPKRFSSQTSPDLRATLTRSRSTIGTSADTGAMTDISRPTLEQIGQPSGLAAVAAAVSDPWREHSPADGCEDDSIHILPPPAFPVEQQDLDRRRSEDDIHTVDALSSTARHGLETRSKPTLPRLNILPQQDARLLPTLERSRRSSSHRGSNNNGGISSASTFSSWDAFKRRIRPTIRALFPSLRHFHEKSWLGIIVGLITAPAIFVLKLTLPVVDDEADNAAVAGQEKVGSYNGSGSIRLEGDDAALMARPAFVADESGDETEGQGRRDVIDLSTAAPATENPWDASLDQDYNNSGDRDREGNQREQRHIAAALRRLPEDSSPLLQGDSSKKRDKRAQQEQQHQRSASETMSQSSDESCTSADSHAQSPVSQTFLMIAQCALAPPFCMWTITTSARSKHIGAKTMLALLCGMCLAVVVLLGTARIRRSGQQVFPAKLLVSCGWARVGLGFFVSVLYIMTIVDEVVSILQTLGLVLGLSDAILGLTVFAMGNSLGDLVANITIARMGHPVMAISACFAGPLLNLLLGIGISGSYLLSRQHVDDALAVSGPLTSIMKNHRHAMQEPGVYHIDFSPTLVVSGFGLLLILVGTMIAVPLNGFHLNRTIGMTLIITYAVIMCVNIGVEVYNLKHLVA